MHTDFGYHFFLYNLLFISNYSVDFTISSSVKQILNLAQFINKIIINNQTFSMSKAKVPNKVTVEASDESSESDLPELAVNNKASKKQVVQQKKVVKKVQQEQSDEEDTPVVKQVAKKGRKPSAEEESVPKDKVKKMVKTSEPVRKVSLDKTKKTAMKAESSQESEQQQKPKAVVKNTPKPTTAVQPPKKNTKMVAESEDSESEDEIIEKPKPKGTSPKVQAVKSPVNKPKASPKIQPKAAKKPVSQQQQSESEQQKPVAKKGKIINQKPVAKKPVKQSSQEQQEQQVKPKRKTSKDVVAKKPAKKVEQIKESSEDEEQVKPNRKTSKDLKINGKKAADDEQGEFEVCVQQLSYQAFQNDVKEHFEPCGEIISVRVLTRPDGKSKGTGFVKFAWKSAYNKALELDGSDMMGRPIKVSEAQNKTFENKNGGGFNNDRNGGFNNNNRAPRQNQNFESNANIENPTLFIGGLSYQSTVESIQHHFKGCGNVISARIVSDRETGKPRGFGYVQFSDLAQAQAAYKSMNGSMLDGRQIRLDASTQRDRPQGGGFNRGGDRNGGGFNRGGDRGGFNRGGNSQVDLSQEDRNLKSGAIGTFQGKKVML